MTTTKQTSGEPIRALHHTPDYWEHAEPGDPRLGGPIHPGEILMEDFLKPLGVSINKLASDLGITYRRAHELCTGKRGISAETALLLAKYFRMSPQFWLNLQNSYELDCLRGRMKEKMSRVRVLPRPDLDSSEEPPATANPSGNRTKARR